MNETIFLNLKTKHMESIHIILTNLEHLRNILMALPERKTLPIAAFTPIVIFGFFFLREYIKFYFSNEKTN